jgi:putative ABC transport system ATP-binding protein
VIPVLIQQILDKGVLTGEGFRPGFTFAACGLALAITLAVTLLGRLTLIRLTTTAETMLRNLRVKTFAHIHSLSVADHNEAKRGVLTSRVTSDIETLARFAQWGAIAWIVDLIVIVGVLGVMAIYQWRLALITFVVLVPLVPLMRVLQRKQLRAYDVQRTRVGQTLSAISESVMGSGVVRAYGVVERTRGHLDHAIAEQYRAETKAARYFALMFPLGDLFGAAAMAAVLGAGALWGPWWGMDAGALVACLFLVNLILAPVAELGEILDQTQTAIAGWRKVLDVLDIPVDVIEPDPGVTLPGGALAVRAVGVEFAYREGGRVLHGVDVDLPAGVKWRSWARRVQSQNDFRETAVPADPSAGSITVAGVDLRQVAPASRHQAVRMVPQDGFLFDSTVRENVRMGRDDATDAEIDAAFTDLGLDWWVARLPDGLDSEVGERGESLSVGERQLVALPRPAGQSRAAHPRQATSAVDRDRLGCPRLVRLAGTTVASPTGVHREAQT